MYFKSFYLLMSITINIKHITYYYIWNTTKLSGLNIKAKINFFMQERDFCWSATGHAWGGESWLDAWLFEDIENGLSILKLVIWTAYNMLSDNMKFKQLCPLMPALPFFPNIIFLFFNYLWILYNTYRLYSPSVFPRCTLQYNAHAPPPNNQKFKKMFNLCCP